MHCIFLKRFFEQSYYSSDQYDWNWILSLTKKTYSFHKILQIQETFSKTFGQIYWNKLEFSLQDKTFVVSCVKTDNLELKDERFVWIEGESE